MARVELEKVSKVFVGGVRAVDGVDIVVADREFVVLVGPSGCGKSTTLRMIAGLEDVTEGIVRIGERVVNDVSPKNRDIAMVFQNYALYPHMTVYENMAFGLKLRGVEKAEIGRRVGRAAEILDLGGLLERKPRALSGGQRQRVAVGRAIVREPAAFLFDEPLSNLDAKLRVTTRAELKRLHQRLSTTTVYVTHDQEEAMTLGDRIVVMKDGKVQQADSPLRTYNNPVNRFVAGFIGMPPMNFFDGTIKNAGGRLFFEEGRVVRKDGLGGKKERADERNGGAWELTLPGNGFTLAVAAHLSEVAGQWIGRHVVMGIRPEHFQLRPTDKEILFEEVSATVSVIEPLGNDMDVYFELPLHDRVVGRVEAISGLEIGSRIKAYVNPRKVHLFEPGETGMNLSLTSEPAYAIA